MARRTSVPSSNVAAAQATVDELHKLGRLEPVDGALVRAVLTLAAAVDDDPGHASLWKEYRGALELLMGRGGDGKVDEFGALLERLDAMSAEVGDAAPRGPKVSRR